MSMTQRDLPSFFPRFRDIIFFTVFTSILFLGPRMLSIDSDLGRHLTVGRYILNHHLIPTHDLFSYTLNGQARPPYEWLSQVFFALTFNLAGLDGDILLSALVIASTFAIVYTDTTQRSGQPLTALGLTLLAAVAGSLHWLPRPHIFTFVLLAIWLERLEKLRKGDPVPLWPFFLLMLGWANLHGGFVFGLLAWAAYLAGWSWDFLRGKGRSTIELGKKLLMVGLLSLLASIITPDGWKNWIAVLSNNSRFILSRTAETMPPAFSLPNTWPYLFLLLLSVIQLLRKRLSAAHGFLLLGLTITSLLMARNIPIFAIAACPILAESIRAVPDRIKLWKSVESVFAEIHFSSHNIAWPIVVTLSATIFFGAHYAVSGKSFNQFNPVVFPDKAVNWLMENPQNGNMFNEFNWGGYLLYRLWPQELVFLDSQTDFYGETLVREYEQTILAKYGWEDILSRYNVTWAIIPPNSPLSQALQTDEHWQVLYHDNTAIILRQSP